MKKIISYLIMTTESDGIEVFVYKFNNTIYLRDKDGINLFTDLTQPNNCGNNNTHLKFPPKLGSLLYPLMSSLQV